MAGDRVVAGHNEDWYPGDVDTLAVRHVTLRGGPSYMSVGPAGYLPITGVTSNGFSARPTPCTQRTCRSACPTTWCSRDCCSAATWTTCSLTSAALPRARGSNHLLCDAAGRILDVETTANHLAVMDGGSRFVHTNHYLDADMLPLEAYRSQGTPKRYARAAELLTAGLAAGDDPVDCRKRVQRDHANAPLSICAHWNDEDPAPGPDGDHGQHGLGAGRRPRARGRRPALRARVRDLHALASPGSPAGRRPAGALACQSGPRPLFRP